MEIITQKSFEFWGPWALVTLILLLGLILLANYFLKRQKLWDIKDEARIKSFIELDEKRSQAFLQAHTQNLAATALLSKNVENNTKAVDELRTATHANNQFIQSATDHLNQLREVVGTIHTDLAVIKQRKR